MTIAHKKGLNSPWHSSNFLKFIFSYIKGIYHISFIISQFVLISSFKFDQNGSRYLMRESLLMRGTTIFVHVLTSKWKFKICVQTLIFNNYMFTIYFRKALKGLLLKAILLIFLNDYRKNKTVEFIVYYLSYLTLFWFQTLNLTKMDRKKLHFCSLLCSCYIVVNAICFQCILGRLWKIYFQKPSSSCDLRRISFTILFLL